MHPHMSIHNDCIIETGAISIVVNHNRDYSHTKSAFPPKPFFGVEPCIIDTETVTAPSAYFNVVQYRSACI